MFVDDHRDADTYATIYGDAATDVYALPAGRVSDSHTQTMPA